MVWIWWKTRPNLLHATHSSIPALWPGKLIVTFHDLIRHQSKGKGTTTRKYFLYWFKYLGYLFVDLLAMYRAKIIIVPARFWKDLLVNKYHLSSDKIAVTYEGVDTIIKQGKPSNEDFGVKKPFLVYTGNLYPHKNIPVLLKAIKILNGKIHLALVGARSVFTRRAQQLIAEQKVNDSVTFLGRLTDIQLISLYSQAVAFVFPSLIEGFGLTGLEAMAVELPVIAARASCLPEVYGDAALYFDPYDPQDLTKKITEVVKSKSLRDNLIKKGLLQVKKYSWDKMSRQTWQIYQNALL